LGADLEHLTEASRRDWVYWRTAASSGAESERAARGVELHGCPVTVGDVARRLLKDRSTAAVLTSATLSAASDFAFSAARLGLGGLRQGLPPSARLLAQEWDGSPSLVSERFRAERGAVLLGVQSLWEGVDFPGEALEILVVAKLPFSVPDDPLVEARGERLAG